MHSPRGFSLHNYILKSVKKYKHKSFESASCTQDCTKRKKDHVTKKKHINISHLAKEGTDECSGQGIGNFQLLIFSLLEVMMAPSILTLLHFQVTK